MPTDTTPLTGDTDVAFDSNATLSAFQDSLPVALIATPRAKLKTCEAGGDLVEAVRSRGIFDNLPVTEMQSDGRTLIVGLLEASKLEQEGRLTGKVRDRMERLSERLLIGADASIVYWLARPEQTACRFLVMKGEITGFITPSDVQHLAVRAALFALLTHLEAAMTDAIRHEYDDTAAWLERLEGQDRKTVQSRIDRAERNNTLIDQLNYTDLRHKYTILEKSPDWGEIAQERSVFKRISDLRNKVAHMKEIEPFQDVIFADTIGQISRWTSKLAAWSGR